MSELYRLVSSRSTAADFHARTVPEPAIAEIWRHEITASALVLGSTQSEEVVDRDACDRAGVEVVRRRSGGGAVFLRPGEVSWIDVIVPRGAPGWSDDVHASMVWLGEHLGGAAAALLAGDGSSPPGDVSVHTGSMISTSWSRMVCFDGVGAGEVLLGGRKLIGISQRRTRTSARLQCCWYSAHDPADLLSLLLPQHRPPVAELASVATVAPSIADAISTTLAARL